MEIQIPSAQGSSLCNKNNADKKASDKERKIGRYLGKYNLFKANLETKIRSRLNFLKEKVMRNVNEIRRLAQMLFTHKISALPSSDMDKKKYFHILKTKKQREVNSKDDEDYLNHSRADMSNENNYVDYEQFFKYKHYSSDSNESDNSGTLSENEDQLCDKFSQTTLNPHRSFRKAFTTNFVNLNQFKEEDTESEQTINDKPSMKSGSSGKDTSIKSNNNINLEDIKITKANKELQVFNENEMSNFNNIFNELKELNLAANDPDKLNNLLNSETFQELRKKKKYNMISPETKRKYVEMAKETDAKEVSRNFGIPLKSLKRWLLLGHERKKGGGRKLKDPDMEKKLYEWYKEYHDRNQKIVTAKLIKQKALELTKCKDFIASKGWLEKFRKQHNLDIIRETTARKFFDYNKNIN
jgi:transposase-like protein